MNKKVLLLLLPFAVGTLAGCESAKPNPPVDQCDQAQVTLNKTEVTLKVGETVELVATAPEACGDLGWGVDEAGQSVVSLQKDGKKCTVTATSVGTAIVGYGTTASCTIKVVNEEVVPVTGVAFEKSNYEVKPGQSVNVLAHVTPSNATEKGITYSLKDANPADCATISSNIVTAVKEGSVKVVATSKDGGFTAEATVTISSEAPDPEPVHAGTIDDPFDASDAVLVANKLEKGGVTASDYYIKGIAENAEFVSKYSSYSFEIGQGFLCYSLNNGSTKAPFNEGDIENGDEVTVFAKIQKFHQAASGDKPERTILETKGGYVVNIKKPGEGDPVSIKEIKSGPLEVEQGTNLHASDYVITLNMSTGTTKDVVPTGIEVDTSEVGDNVRLVLKYTGLQDYVTTIKVTAPAPRVVGDFYRIKSADEITAGTYLLGYEVSATEVKLHNGVDAVNGYIDATMSNGHIAANSSYHKLALEEMTGGFALKVLDGDNAGKYLSGTSGSNGTKVTTDKQLNTVEHTADGDLIVSNTSTIMFNKASDQMRFRYYKAGTTSQQPVHLYKMHEAAPAELVSISVDSSQVKKEYYVGDSLDTTNLVVTAHYNNESEKVIASGYEIDPESFEVAGDSVPVTISYGGKSADPFNVKVNEARTITSVVITNFPSEIEQGTTAAELIEEVKVTVNYSSGDPLTGQKPSSVTCDTSTVGPSTLSAKYDGVDSSDTKDVTIIPKVYVSGCKAAVELAATLQPGQTSEVEVEISGRIMFMPGNNLIIQDGDYSVIVWKNGQSTQEMQVGKKASMKCKVQNYNGAAETVQLANAAVTISDQDVPTVNKATITSKAEFEAIPFSSYCKFENVILKSKPALASGSDATITVAFKDDTTTEYQFFVKKSLYAKSYADILNSMEIGGEFTLDEAYVGVYAKSGVVYKQLCSGLSSVVTDNTHYNPESVSITKDGEAVTTLNLGAGDSVQLDAAVLPEKASQDVVWSVEPAGVVTVEDGLVSVVAESDSQAVVKATANGTEIYGSVTVNVTLVHEITSIEISGQMKTEYTLKDTDYDVSGLTVTAIYNSDPTDTEDVTDEVEWSFDPVFPAVVTDSLNVEVTATLEEAGVDDSIIETISISKEKEYMDLEIPVTGMAGETVTSTSYVNENKEITELGMKFGVYGFTGKGHIRGNKSVIVNSSSKENTGNFHMYNIDELSRDIKSITISCDKNDSNYFKAGMSLVYGDEFQGDLTAIPEEGVVTGVVNEGKNEITFDLSDVSFKYFKICAKSTFTNGTLTGTKITLNIEKPEGGIKVDSVELSKKTLTLAPEATQTLEATVGPSYADNKELEWSSDNTDVAVVDQSGKVTAVADGKATITATAKDGSGVSDSCVVTVQSGAVVINPITLSTDGGTSASTATVKIPNGDDTTTDVTGAIKCGTTSAFGAMKIKIPKGATKLVFYAAGWKGEAVTLSISGLSGDKTIALTADTGITGSSPFTLSTSDMENFYKEIDLGTALEEETTITLTATGGKRFVVWSAGYIA